MAIRSPSRPHLGILMLLVLLLPILAACAGTAATQAPTGAPGTTAPSAEPSEAAGGGIMTAAWIGPCCLDVDTNNVLTAGGDYHWWNKIHTRLFTYTVKDQQYGELVGELADTWSVSDDKLTWTIKIRDGVVWNDGTPLTAEDVKFSMELCLDPATGGCTNAGFLAPIAVDFQDGSSLNAMRVDLYVQ
jgi:ABC-type transport system substrate-binding protein